MHSGSLVYRNRGFDKAPRCFSSLASRMKLQQFLVSRLVFIRLKDSQRRSLYLPRSLGSGSQLSNPFEHVIRMGAGQARVEGNFEIKDSAGIVFCTFMANRSYFAASVLAAGIC